MNKKINYKKIIKINPLIDEKKFQIAQDLIEERKKTINTQVGYDIVPPFTTKRHLKTSDETNLLPNKQIIQFSFWINSKDSLPKKGEQVLVYHTAHDYINIEYFAGNKRWLNGMKAENTYWMPLPKKPKLIKN